VSSVRDKTRLEPKWRTELPDHVIALAWSANDRQIAAAAVSGPVAIIDADSGVIRHWLAGHGFGTTAVAWMDADTIVSAGQDGKIRYWQASSGAERFALDAGAAWVEQLSVSPCGTYLASAAGRRMCLWHCQGRLLQSYPDQASTIADLAWRPGALELASAAYGGVSLWEPGSTSCRRRFEWKGSVLKLAWSPDGKYLATGDQDSTVHYWLYASGEDLQMSGYPGKVRELAWDRTSRFLATGGGPQVTVWDCSGKGPRGTTPVSLCAHDETSTVSCLAFQHWGSRLASGGSDGQVVLWRPEKGGRPLAKTQLDGGVTIVAWSGGDDRLAVGGSSGELALYQV
jgi:WD40 repeat protein